MKTARTAALLLLLFLITSAARAGANRPEPISSAAEAYPPAPEWVISEWINGEETTLAQSRGQVVVVEFFQLWCPGCNQFSIPLMQRWHETFAPEIVAGRLTLLSIHTVFEGHDYQTPARLRKFVKEKGIEHLVGIDRHRKGEEIPETMKRFGTRGTPEMAIIDRQGRIRFQRFGGFEPARAETLLRELLEEQVEEANGSKPYVTRSY